MDIAGLSMTMAQNRVMSDVSVAMLSKSIDLGQDVAEGMVEMLDASAVSRSAMELSVNPSIGSNIDLSV